VQRNNNDILISGVVSNMRSYYLQRLQLTARLMNEQGKVIARGTYVTFPDYLAPGTPAPFLLEFHLPHGTLVKQVHFSYIYWVFNAEPAFRVYVNVPRLGTFASPL
jgi:hypothetical protein